MFDFEIDLTPSTGMYINLDSSNHVRPLFNYGVDNKSEKDLDYYIYSFVYGNSEPVEIKTTDNKFQPAYDLNPGTYTFILKAVDYTGNISETIKKSYNVLTKGFPFFIETIEIETEKIKGYLTIQKMYEKFVILKYEFNKQGYLVYEKNGDKYTYTNEALELGIEYNFYLESFEPVSEGD